MRSLDAAYDAHAGALFRHGLALLGQAADAEDALHAVFVKLAARPRLLPMPRDLQAYLHVALRREAARIRLRRGRDEPMDGALLVPAPEGPAVDEVEPLARALAGLPPDQREVAVLKGLEGWTLEEIGARLGLSPNTVATRWRLAKERLRIALREPKEIPS